MTDTTWPCAAYGVEGVAHGALCFVAGELGERICVGRTECEAVMTAERQRIFQRINELAAAGSPDFAYLADHFPQPGDLLNDDDGAVPPR